MRSKLLKEQSATVAPVLDIPTLKEARARLFGPVDEAEVTEEEFEREWESGLTLEESKVDSARFLEALVKRSKARNAPGK